MKISQKVTVEMTVEDVQKACALYIESKGLTGVQPKKVILGQDGARVTFQTGEETSMPMSEPCSNETSACKKQQTPSIVEDTVTSFEGGITPIQQETIKHPAEEVSGELITSETETPPFDTEAMKSHPLFK